MSTIGRDVRGAALSARTTSIPGRTLADAYRLCDPFTPLDPVADPALREDLTAIRGGDPLGDVVRAIGWSGGIATLHFLAGHLGSGKTTELMRMRRRLEALDPAATVLWMDADVLLDRNDVELEDLLVALWAVAFEIDKVAAAEVLQRVWKEQIASVLARTLTNLPETADPAVKKLLRDIKVPALDQRKQIRTAIGSMVGPLISGLNEALRVLGSRDGNDAAGPVVVLIDNLEKLSQGQRENVERLFTERMVALKDLEAHLVITVPLYLCYGAAGASLVGLYGGTNVVFPMVKVRERIVDGGGQASAGLDALADLLAKRVDPKLFADGRAALREIARLSGGCIRHALRVLQGAINQQDAPPIRPDSIKRAASAVRGDFERALPEGWVPYLHRIADTNRFPDDCPIEVKRDLLRHLYVLEYQGDDREPWWGVHPLVEQCRKYEDWKPAPPSKPAPSA